MNGDIKRQEVEPCSQSEEKSLLTHVLQHTANGTYPVENTAFWQEMLQCSNDPPNLSTNGKDLLVYGNGVTKIVKGSAMLTYTHFGDEVCQPNDILRMATGELGPVYQAPEIQSSTMLDESFDRSSPPPLPRVYRPCVVCSDKSSGYHYGVSSCEGCKGFFRRSIQKNVQYTCHKEQNCVVSKATRNRCQYCRLQKCYESGMSKEAVRNDRNKKRKQLLITKCPSEAVQGEVSPEENDVIGRLTSAHEDTFPDKDDKFSLTDEELSKGDVFLWERVSELSSLAIRRIVHFSKQVPGFNTLHCPDQIVLLKGACLEIMILRLSSCYNSSDGTVTFSNGLYLTRRQFEVGGFGLLTDAIYHFADSMSQLQVDSSEYALLAAICLMSGDRPGLEKPHLLEPLQEPLLEALKHYVRRRRPSCPHVFAKLLMKLTDLRSISIKGAEHVLHLKTSGDSVLPPLVVEMLDRSDNVSIS